MKIFFIQVFILLSSILTLTAQLQMDVEEITLSKIKHISLDNQSGIELEELTTKEHDRNSPFLETLLKITNNSDTTIVFSIDKAQLDILYRLDNKQYRKEMTFYVKDIGKSSEKDGNHIILPHHYLYLKSFGYVIDQGSVLDLRTLMLLDFTSILLKILPTLKYQYIDKSGLIINQNEIYKVNIEGGNASHTDIYQ